MNMYRPIYHFMPEKNWMNDPNGPIFYKGEYHLFYQHNPRDYKWDTMHWGHAKSKDLVHWEHLPIALYPSNELGETHCFSGCTILDDDGTPTIFYTSIGEGERNAAVGAEQWMAISKDNMLSWQKPEANPVLKLDLHGDINITEWRDPFVWKEGEIWYMVLGGTHDNKGCSLIYSSENLLNWQFLNILYKSDEHKYLECPNLFKLEDKYVLVYSPSDKVEYHIGQLNSDFTFKSEHRGILDDSGWEGYYAPNSLIDPKGRRIMWGWMTEASRDQFNGITGWAGAQSIPRILTLSKSGRLRMEPVPELESLRDETISLREREISASLDLDIEGRALEIIAEFELSGDEEFSIDVLRSPDGKEKTSVMYNALTGELTVDRSKSTLSDMPHKTNLHTDLALYKGDTLKLHIFVDHSIIEVFANYEKCISTRIYPMSEESTKAYLSSLNGGALKIKGIDIWKLKSIW